MPGPAAACGTMVPAIAAAARRSAGRKSAHAPTAVVEKTLHVSINDYVRRPYTYRGISTWGHTPVGEDIVHKLTMFRHAVGSRPLSGDLRASDLVAAYLRQVADEADGCWARLEQAHPGDPRAQLRAWFKEMAPEQFPRMRFPEKRQYSFRAFEALEGRLAGLRSLEIGRLRLRQALARRLRRRLRPGGRELVYRAARGLGVVVGVAGQRDSHDDDLLSLGALDERRAECLVVGSVHA